MIIGGTVAWWACVLLGAPRQLFAVLVPLVAMGGDPFGAVNVSADRIAGVFVRLGLLQVDLPSTLLVLVLLTISLLCGLAIRVGGGPLNNQIAISAMFMLYLGVGDRAQVVGINRIWETAIGAAVAVAMAALLRPPDPVLEVRDRVQQLGDRLAEDLMRRSARLSGRSSRRRLVNIVRELALPLNPRHRLDIRALRVQRGRLTSAAWQYRHLCSVMRMIADIADQQPLPSSDRSRLANSILGHPAARPDPHRLRTHPLSEHCTILARRPSRSSSRRGWPPTWRRHIPANRTSRRGRRVPAPAVRGGPDRAAARAPDRLAPGCSGDGEHEPARGALRATGGSAAARTCQAPRCGNRDGAARGTGRRRLARIRQTPRRERSRGWRFCARGSRARARRRRRTTAG